MQMQYSALLLCHADPARDPRPSRVLRWLRELDFAVTVVSQNFSKEQERVSFVSLPPEVSPYVKLGRFAPYARMAELFSARSSGRFERLARPSWMAEMVLTLSFRKFDIIVCSDLDLLPLAFGLKGEGKVLFDAREFYPRQFEDRPLWRNTHGRFARRLCEKFLPSVDRVVTVSQGLQKAYFETFGIEADLLMSLPAGLDLKPVPTKDDRIRLIYHGNANRSRTIEVMVELANALDERFHMDFMILPQEGRYIRHLKKLAAHNSRVRFIVPQSLDGIVPFINSYDIGVFLVPPTNFNLRHCLPNKFFEYIQARLAIAIGPSPDMMEVVSAHKLGVVSDDWDALSLAKKLNALSTSEIAEYKRNSHTLAFQLTAEENFSLFRKLCAELLDAQDWDTTHKVSEALK